MWFVIPTSSYERGFNMTGSTNRTNSNSVIFKLITATIDGNTVYRVQATIPGFSPAYLVKPEGNDTFPNRSAAIKAAKRRAITLGYTPEITNSTTRRSRQTATI